MNLYLTRDGQTFGPYTVEQAREYLIGGQFLEQDFALFEGQTEWQSLGQLLASAELSQPVEAAFGRNIVCHRSIPDARRLIR